MCTCICIDALDREREKETFRQINVTLYAKRCISPKTRQRLLLFKKDQKDPKKMPPIIQKGRGKHNGPATDKQCSYVSPNTSPTEIAHIYEKLNYNF